MHARNSMFRWGKQWPKSLRIRGIALGRGSRNCSPRRVPSVKRHRIADEPGVVEALAATPSANDMHIRMDDAPLTVIARRRTLR